MKKRTVRSTKKDLNKKTIRKGGILSLVHCTNPRRINPDDLINPVYMASND